jgi:Putative lumazine-binding
MGSLPERIDASQADKDAITKVALDYLEGYVCADPARHLGAYHPEAIKRRYFEDRDGVFGVTTLSPQTMADLAAVQTPGDSAGEVIIDDVYGDIASVRLYSSRWVDYLHIVKARGEWKLFHVTWRPVDTETGS